MHVMILAAGRGERMMPLTKSTPKSLLKVAGISLIEHQLRRLIAAGYKDFVINHGRFGEQIEKELGSGSSFGCKINYSKEGEEILETGGGIYKALPMLESGPFIAVNADVWTDYDFSQLPTKLDGKAHLVLVENPPHNKQGDFGLERGQVKNQSDILYTFSGIGVYSAALFKSENTGRFPLAPLLRKACDKSQVSGELFKGSWNDIGTPERLQEIREKQEK